MIPEGVSTGDAIVFWILAAFVTFCAIFTITRNNPVTAVMSLVGTFFGLAAIYAMLSAHFLAVMQVLVYAGAIMVLFIFVVMILNREEVAPLSFRPSRVLGVVAGVYLFVKFVDVMAVPGCRRACRPSRSPRPSAPSARSATSCSATSSIRSRRSRSCCWSPSSAAWSSRARTRTRSPPTARPTPQEVHELASHDYPGAARGLRAGAGRAPLGSAMPTTYYLVLSFLLFLIGTTRRAAAPQRAHHADGRSSCSSTPAT